MKSSGSFHEKGRAWVPPTIMRLAIGTETNSPPGVHRRIESGLSGSDSIKSAEPQPPATPASKFGFTLEWSFPLSARAE
jgi:hypothetical protein